MHRYVDRLRNPGRSSADDAAGTGIVGNAVIAGQGIVSDAVRAGGVDHLTVAHVDADMGDIHVIAREEDEVARLQVGFVDRVASGDLDISSPWQVDAVLGVNVLDEAGTVKSVR